jgi:hypothetical protein
LRPCCSLPTCGYPLKTAEQQALQLIGEAHTPLSPDRLTAEQISLLVQGLLFGNPTQQRYLLNKTREGFRAHPQLHLARLWAEKHWLSLAKRLRVNPNEGFLPLLVALAGKHQQPFLRRRAAELLEMLGYPAVPSVPGPKRRAGGSTRNPSVPPAPLPDDTTAILPLDQLLARLNRQGVQLRTGRVYPHISIGTKTGRVTYRQPPLQSWGKDQREREIEAARGFTIFRFDFTAMEPTVLGNSLITEGYLHRRQWPAGDIYEALAAVPAATPRKVAKKWLMAFMYGAVTSPPFAPSDFFKALLPAFLAWREALLAKVAESGYVTTIADRAIAVDKATLAQPGKVVNYLIQGSAADIFHHLLLQLDGAIADKALLARIVLLLCDEFWLEVANDSLAEVLPLVDEVRDAVNSFFRLPLPQRLRLTGG